MKKFPLLCATLASTALLNSLQIPMPLRSSEMLLDSAAYAKRSGGRSGGGSFSRPSSGSSNRNSGSESGGSVAPRSSGGGVYYGGGYGGGTYYGGGSIVLLIVALMLIGGVGFFVWYLLKMGKSNKGQKELDNDVVTVTKVQVGLLAEGRAIQPQLAEIVQQAETETIEGLHAQLQEAALALLRMPENWSHVQASSETVKTRDEAEKRFNQLSIAERTKYTTETLTNANGKLVQKEFELDPDKEPASYIVVTLIVGTADDQPLFSEIRTTEALKDVLHQLSSLNFEYLMRFELQWTPQVEGDSLTYDEMLLEYPEMLQI
ncbi:DUF1517 domain-containing protein [Leptolyngbya sp. NIES-2104]|uniref:DUF1517 domain-containing protein n=1 Tax=Leptolyngbya sp. NIES-2104 TaxID=1552121 RepID=UPI0006EC71A8|nr:DUF1517 domain-containing protein [Leptolyngbya sp. NIES-2104]GAP96764.1 hypothetical glycine rich membrane protein DUF1517 [Leptolyngbya sp. NIES-2104]